MLSSFLTPFPIWTLKWIIGILSTLLVFLRMGENSSSEYSPMLFRSSDLNLEWDGEVLLLDFKFPLFADIVIFGVPSCKLLGDS